MAGTDDRVSPSAAAPAPSEFHNYAPWINVICGLMVFALRYLAPRGTFSVHWNLFLTGIVIMFAALAMTISHGDTTTNYWSGINVAAGIWLLISANTIPSIPPVTVSQMALGAVIIAIAIVSVIVEVSAQRHVDRLSQ